MRVAALYDIHGNLPALEAVLAEVRDEGVDAVVVGGDVVPGPMPGECMAALQEQSVPLRCIRGNGENDVLALDRGETLARVPEAFHGMMRWVAAELSAADIAELAVWPLTERLEIGGLGDVLFCHATPRDDNEIFTCITPEERLEPAFAAADAALVVCGHTHMQFDRTAGALRVVNAGSVGMPFGRPGAQWLLLESEDVQLRYTPYDLHAAAARIGATGYPLEFDPSQPPDAEQMLKTFEAAALK